MIYNSSSKTVFKKKSSKHLTIGVIKSQFCDQRDVLMVEGLKQAAYENGVTLIVYRGGMIASPNDIDLQAISIFDFVDRNRLDGLIIWTGNINWHASAEFTEKFVKKYNFLPVVSLEIKIDGITSILWDDYNGMREALVHLIEVHNHKRIGFVMGNAPQSLYHRYEAYIDTLTQYGLPINPKLIIDHDTLYDFQNIMKYALYMDRSIFVEQAVIDNFEKSTRIVKELCAEGIDALACCNDLNARTVSRFFKTANLPQIPIVGFDDDPESKAFNPALTSVRPPIYEMGKRAVEVIIAKINGHKTLESESIPCSLIVRQSCGCKNSSLIREDLYREVLKQYLIPKDIDIINANKFDKFLRGIISVPDDFDADADWSEKLIRAFLDDVKGESEVFFDYIKSFFVLKSGKKYFEIFQDIIIVMNFFVDSFIKNDCFDYYKSKKLLQQGAFLISDIRLRMEMSKRLKQTQRHFDIITFSQLVSNSYDINEILEKTAYSLKFLGISTCYLSVYENGSVSTEKARLVLAYHENENIKIPSDVCLFPSKLLVPEEVLSFDKRCNYVLKSLHFRSKNIGFVIFADTLDDSTEYERITEAISNAIHTAFWVDELKSKTQELIRINSDIESAYSLLQENQQKLLVSEKMASLGRLTAGIAHEMNTPLAAVRTSLKELGELIHEYSESIDNPSVLPEDHRLIAADMMKCMKLAVQSAEKSARFIKAIKSQTTNMNDSNLQVFNVANVIKDAIEVLGFALKKGNCSLVMNFDNSIKLYGDPNKLVQVSTNLVINSIDACKPNGGNISITLENNGDGFAKLTFQDTGCGIPEEIKSRIFDPMFTTKPFGEGTGLGLSIVHDMINEFNGRINLESQKGLTSFFIFLPIKE